MRLRARYRHGVGLCRGAVLGGDLDLEGVRAHRECDGAARLAAGDRGQARSLAHLHCCVGVVHRRGQFHAGDGMGHRGGVGRGARGERADVQRRERAPGTRAARRHQSGQGRVGGLRLLRLRAGYRHGVGLCCGAVLGGDLDLEGVRTHRERDGGARLTAGDRGQARPLAHLHCCVGAVHRRGQFHAGDGIAHRRRVGRGARGERADVQCRERARGARAACRCQSGQGSVVGLRRRREARHRHGVGLRGGAVLGGDLDLEGVRAHRECDGAARRAAGDRGQARPLAHLHRGVGFVDRRGQFHVGSGIGHRDRVGRGARGERADAQRSERARCARAACRRQSGQGRIGGLRLCARYVHGVGLGRAAVLGGDFDLEGVRAHRECDGAARRAAGDRGQA